MLPHKVDIIPSDYIVNIPSVEQDECNKKELDGLSCRCPSQSSSMYSNAADICRICHCEGTNEAPLITPCYCSGSLRYVHQGCLQQWIKSSDIRCCELCKFQFIMQTKIKPFNEWEYLEMSGLERKKLLCAMVFHIIAMTCVCWSLYVLIDRTLDEVQRGHLDWPFWTKLMVVGIGFMGGIVFMYIQCKAYFILCQRWKAYNRVIYVQNVPEKQRPKAVVQEINERDVPSTSLKSCSAANNDCVGGGGKEIVQNSGSCIDIKGVRNLHIFFNEENRVRLHKQELPMNQTAYSDNPTTLPPPVVLATGPDGCSSTCSKKEEKKTATPENTSWHIEIGDSHRTNTSPSTSTSNDLAHYGGAISPSENNGAEKELSPQLILQIKKAEIVIEFGGQNNSPDGSEFCEKNCETCRGEKCDDYINNFNFVDSTVGNLPTSRLLKSYSDANLCDNKNHQLTDWSSNDNLLLKH